MTSVSLPFIASMAMVVRLAMAVTFAGVMTGMSSLLRHPFHRVLAWLLWTRAIASVVGVIAWTTPSPDDPTTFFVAACSGVIAMVTAILSLRAVQLAADADAALRARTWTTAAIVGAILGVIGEITNLWLDADVVVVGFVWNRLLQVAGYSGAMVVALQLYRQRAAFRARLRPLIVAFASAVAGFTVDIGLRTHQIVTHGSVAIELQSAIALTVAMLLFGIGVMWAALEIEREQLTANADALRQSTTAASEVMRLESLGRLASGVAHDFNNLLTIVRTSTDMVRDQLPLSAHATHRELAQAVELTNHAAALSTRVLQFAKRGPVAARATCIRGLVDGLEPMLTRLLPDHVRLTATTTTAPAAWVDPTLLEQALVNLVVNAAEALPDGGQVDVTVSSVHLHNARAYTLGRIGPGAFVRVAVRDGGVGMTDGVQARAFDPFFTTKDASHPGLGMVTVSRFALDAAGAVEIETAAGAGTIASLYLPAAPAVA